MEFEVCAKTAGFCSVGHTLKAKTREKKLSATVHIYSPMLMTWELLCSIFVKKQVHHIATFTIIQIVEWIAEILFLLFFAYYCYVMGQT